MSKRNKESEKEEEVVVEQVEEVKSAPSMSSPPPAEKSDDKKPIETEKPEPMLTFSRYFAYTGKPEHHKSGMVAWLSKRGGTNGRRTAKSWTDLFSKY